MQALARYIQSHPGRTNAQWADALGVSRPYLHALLSEARQPSLETAVVIERATGGLVPVASWPSFAAVVAAVGASEVPHGGDVVLPGVPPVVDNDGEQAGIGASEAFNTPGGGA